MQGILSNTIPEKTEKRGLHPAVSGPLEAAKRYLDRQRENGTSQAATDDHEAEDGRPAWLRRWPSESRREGDAQPQEAKAQAAQGEATALDGDQVHSAGGYSGQSIEAAFAYETIFRFETELEAEATEDWLDLSGESSGPQVQENGLGDARGSNVAEEAEIKAASAANGQHRAAPENQLSFADQERSRSTDGAATSAPSPNPQAVRAAIFRLAQESSGRWTPGSRPQIAETTGNAVTQPWADLAAESVASEKVSTSPDKEFSDVAREIWASREASTEGNQETALTRDPEFDDETHFAMDLDVPSMQTASAEADIREGTDSNAYREAHNLEQTSTRIAAGHPVGTGTPSTQTSYVEVTPSFSPSVAYSVPEESQVSEAAYGSQPWRANPADDRLTSASSTLPAVDSGLANHISEWSLNRALNDIRDEIRSDGSPEPVKASGAEGDLAPLATNAEPGSLSNLQSTAGADGLSELSGGAAGDPPALAHDAGNLLSALKLYSELLALSGVLHARHSHYAQDLKLLASRSEVLIDRLLASCSLAEREVRHQVENMAQNQANQSGHVGHDGQAVNSRELSGEAGLQSAQGQIASQDETQRSGLPVQADGQAATREGANDQRVGTSPEEAQPPLSLKTAESDFAQTEISQSGAPIGSALYSDSHSEETTTAPTPVSLSGPVEGTNEVAADKQSDPVNLVDLLSRWGSLLSMIARGPVEVSFGPLAAMPVRIGEEAMERILVNLVHNAMSATRNGGAIRIGVGRAETRRQSVASASDGGRARPVGGMVLTVDDSGCGMSDEQIARALGRSQPTDGAAISAPAAGGGVPADASRTGSERYAADTDSQRGQRNDAQAPFSGGLRRHGMGLQIVRELVAASGGELAIYSRPGVGTRIEIQWPTIQQIQTQQGQTQQSQASPQTQVHREEGPGRIPPASAEADELSRRLLSGQRSPAHYATTGGPALAGAAPQKPVHGLEGAIAC